LGNEGRGTFLLGSGTGGKNAKMNHRCAQVIRVPSEGGRLHGNHVFKGEGEGKKEDRF